MIDSDENEVTETQTAASADAPPAESTRSASHLAIQQLRDQCVRDCADEVQQVFEKHHCGFRGVPRIANGVIVADVQFFYKD